MRSNLKAGKTAFTFRNRGQFPHNFTVVATLGGGKAFKTATIQPGKTLQKSVNLKPGAYVAVCTVFNGGHLAQGMEKTFTVGRFDQQKGPGAPSARMVARAGRAGPRRGRAARPRAPALVAVVRGCAWELDARRSSGPGPRWTTRVNGCRRPSCSA